MNVYQSSTTMSSNIKSINEIERELLVAEKAGARSETIKAIKERLDEEKALQEQEKRNNDIHFIKLWTNEALLKHYDNATYKAKERMTEVDQLTLMDSKSQKKKRVIKKYEVAIKLVETIETEGQRRQIMPFIPDREIEKVFEAPTKVTSDE